MKAGQSICSCRTAELGGHVQECPDGHFERVWYNSCKHRSCPICAYTQIESWIHRQKERLLNCDYYHTVFTIPSELNPIWEHNRTMVTSRLFQAAWGCLKELLGDSKYLGGLPGAIASFHSWSQTMWIHPHAHFLVTGGGVNPAGQWVKAKNNFLLPGRVLTAKFRGKFLAFLEKELENDKLVLPEGISKQQCANLFNKLGRTKWHVRIMPPYKHGQGVIKYLGRYVRGGPISDHRVRKTGEDSICLRYKDETRTQHKFMTLSVSEFMGRVIRHVPEEGVHHARSYGLFAPAKNQQLDDARKLLGQFPVQNPEELSWQDACSQAGNLHPELCPICGKKLIRRELYASERSPPCQKVA